MGQDHLTQWVPLYLSRCSNDINVHWGFMGQERFTEPFCHETLNKLSSRAFNQFFCQQTGLDVLLQRQKHYPGLPLKGIVFHLSRCGSTLVSQWLTQLADSVVLAEPEPIDKLLQWTENDQDKAWLPALLSAMGQARRASDKQLFLKTDCWHIFYIERILAAFPNTPWVFLYRNPLEVLVSHKRMPGVQMVPGALEKHGLIMPTEQLQQYNDYGAWVLSKILEAAFNAISYKPKGLLINYSQLPDAIDKQIVEHFSLDMTHYNIDQLRTIFKHHSKQGTVAFKADTEDKQHEADPMLKQQVDRWLLQPYLALENLRLKSG